MSKLFEDFELRELLLDLRSVKMTNRLDRIQAQALEHKLELSNDEIAEAWKLIRRYRRKLQELHEARQRAKLSKGRKLLGLTLEQVHQLAQQREDERQQKRDDFGL